MRKIKGYTIPLLLFLVLTISLIPFAVSDADEVPSDLVKNIDARTPAATYVDHDQITIEGDADFISQAADEGWPGLGTKESPFVISGYHIVSPGIQPFIIKNVDSYFELQDNNVTSENTYCGIWYENNSHAVIANNEFHNVHAGMYIVDAVDLLIENNYIHDTMASGIEIEDEMINCTIRDNIIVDPMVSGIQIDEGYDSDVYNNTIQGSSINGIHMKVGSVDIYNNVLSDPGNAGIELGDSCTETKVYDNLIRDAEEGINILGDDNHVYENVIYDSTACGIKMESHSGSGEFASGNDIEDNSIVNSAGHSVEIEEFCTDNTFTGNDFFESDRPNHISDNGTDNIFSENFYDTWIGPDEDVDGFVDNPYAVSGIAENQDLLPIAEPINPIPEGYEYVPIEMPTNTADGLPLDLVPVMVIGAIGIVVVVGIFVVKKK